MVQLRKSFCSGAALRELPAAAEVHLNFSPRAAQSADQQAVYTVDIITGDVRGAGTEARACALVRLPAEYILLLSSPNCAPPLYGQYVLTQSPHHLHYSQNVTK